MEDSDLRPESERVYPTLKTDSEHESRLLRFFALHRIATPYNIMHALPQFFPGHPKTMRHLNWLHNRGYVTRYGTDDSGYIFNIANVGYERCRDSEIAADLALIPYRYTEPTGKQSEHDLLITRCAVSLYRCVRTEPSVSLLYEGRYGLQNISVTDPETGEQLFPFEHLIPDYIYLSRDRNGLMFRMWEVIRGVESIDNLRSMMIEHEQWGNTRAAQVFLHDLYRRHGAKHPKAEYQTHCVVESSSWKHTDEWKERTTMMQTFHVSPQMQIRVWATTKTELDRAFSEGLTINHAIWHRGKDLLEQREHWDRAPDGTRTRLVDAIMRTLPRHQLFA